MFIEFVDPQRAAQFMEGVAGDQAVQGLVNVRKERPIIEHAFFDTRELHKKEEMLRQAKERKQKMDEKEKVLRAIKAPALKAKGKAKGQAKEEEGKTGADAGAATGEPNKAKEERLQRKIQKKAARDNQKLAAKLLVDQALESKDKKALQAAVEAMAKIDSRGAKNRLKRRLQKGFGESKISAETPEKDE